MKHVSKVRMKNETISKLFESWPYPPAFSDTLGRNPGTPARAVLSLRNIPPSLTRPRLSELSFLRITNFFFLNFSCGNARYQFPNDFHCSSALF